MSKTGENFANFSNSSTEASDFTFSLKVIPSNPVRTSGSNPKNPCKSAFPAKAEEALSISTPLAAAC